MGRRRFCPPVSAPLRVGIIGCGNIGARVHLPVWLSHPEIAEIVALADPVETTLEQVRLVAGLSIDQVHADPLELIARSDVDAVDVCTPQYLRREILVEAAAAGKHILCEKPIATIPADAAAAVAAAETVGTTFALVHNYLFLPEVLTTQQVIDSGEIGAVRAVVVNFLGVVDVPGTASYAANWRHDPVFAGGGVLMDMLHGVYVAESLLGEPLRRVSAYIDHRDPEATVEDLALCRFETAINAALVNVGWGLGPGGIEVTGTDGRISVRYRNGGTAPWAPLEQILVTTSTGTRSVWSNALDDTRSAAGIAQSIPDSFDRVALDFLQAAASLKPPRASGADGLRILEATLGAYESAATGRLVTIPLERGGPVFQHGVLGTKELSLPDWSPARGPFLYRPQPTH